MTQRPSLFGVVVAVLVGSAVVVVACAHEAAPPRPLAPAEPFDPAHARGGAMVALPAGTLSMGDASEALSAPVHAVQVPALFVDVTEVTVAAYRECVSASACAPPNTGMFCNWSVDGRDAHPANCVDVAQARAFCQWAGKRLPSEAEWEYAARGVDGRAFPWGADPPGDQACWSGVASRDTTCPVGSSLHDVTPEGVLDLGGNVREWVDGELCPYRADDADAGPKRCGVQTLVNRGGAWNADRAASVLMSPARRVEALAENRNYLLGFRCARSAP